jgi:outer membrane protein
MFFLGSVLLAGQTTAPSVLTLKEAEQIALRNHPRIGVSKALAKAVGETPTEFRAAYYPAVTGSLTGAQSMDNSRIAAGGLNNPVVYDRLAMGVTVSQLITDFKRTDNLVESAKLRVKEQETLTDVTRAQIVQQVDQAYYSVLRAQAVLKVAQQTADARQLVSDQVTTLAENKLKSTLDVSFANVNLSEAKLLVVSARNELQAALSDLSTNLGYSVQQSLAVADEALPEKVSDNTDQLVQQALSARPELTALRLEEGAIVRFAKAEHSLVYPTISALFTTGYIPAGQRQLSDRWVAAGLNISLPIFNGKLFSARHNEALYRSEAANQRVKEMENQIARDVRVAQLNTKTALERMGLMQQFVTQARMAYDLAQSRYDLGLSSIVELSQAQLNRTRAEISDVSARYEYQLQRATLDYQLGLRRY